MRRTKTREPKRLRSNFHKKRKPDYVVPNQNQERFYTKEDIFISRIASILRVHKGDVRRIFSQRARTTIRLNPLKNNVRTTKRDLERRGYQLEAITWAPNTFFVNNRDKAEISQISEYQNGYFYIQDLASILDSLVLDPQKNEDILDMCSAPGSKTTHIAAITRNGSKILANDIEVSRTNSLRNVIEQFGARSAKITLSDGAEFGKKYPNYFDRVLLDAPCSGEGRIYMKVEKSLRFWSIKKVKSSVMIQKSLIESAFKTLKPGGTLVYSTCTLEPDENEGVVSYLLDKYPNAQVEDIDIVNSPEFDKFRDLTTPGILHWSGKSYDPEVKKTVRIIPSSEMMGFYIAKITKLS
jgi:16S rRNA (cytosine1407-C5)-methyltransferase